MARVLEGRDGIKIGVYRFPDRKRPALCVQKGNRLTVYGYFRDDDSARLFMHNLALAIGAVEEPEDGRPEE